MAIDLVRFEVDRHAQHRLQFERDGHDEPRRRDEENCLPNLLRKTLFEDVRGANVGCLESIFKEGTDAQFLYLCYGLQDGDDAPRVMEFSGNLFLK